MSVEAIGRVYGLYRQTAITRSIVALLLANAIPLVGVLFFGWSLMTILVLYWVENGIVGIWNVPRIALAQGSAVPQLPEMPESAALATASPTRAAALRAAWQQARAARARGAAGPIGALPQAGRVAMSFFFLLHYGLFWLGHGLFVLLFLPTFAGGAGSFGTASEARCQAFPTLPADLPPDFPPGLLGGIDGASCNGGLGPILWGSVALGALALFISHGASFLFNYIGRGEYLTTSPTRQIGAPYGRVVVLHLTILLGGLLAAFYGAPLGAVIVLVVLKTILDLGLHLREHRRTDLEAAIDAKTAPPPSAAPMPATTAPMPATTAPMPATTAPMPATTAPMPATTAPMPATTAPMPATTAPMPATTAPMPATTAPMPATTAPMPATTAPMPATTAPMPATTAPMPATTAPMPATTAPMPATTAPMPATTAPMPATTAPPPPAAAPPPASSPLDGANSA